MVESLANVSLDIWLSVCLPSRTSKRVSECTCERGSERLTDGTINRYLPLSMPRQHTKAVLTHTLIQV